MITAGPHFFTTSILPVRESLLLKGGTRTRLPLRVRVGYFHHRRLGHTLIDAGYGVRAVRTDGKPDLLLSAYRKLIKPSTLSDDPLGDGLLRLGLRKSDIETVIITHFHADHISGLADLPVSRILCPKRAWGALKANSRLRNALEGVFASLLPEDFEDRLGFLEDAQVVQAPTELGNGRDIADDGSVLAVDLPGHLEGHTGICFPKLEKPFLYATDVQWLKRAVMEDRCPGFPASMIYHHRGEAMRSVEKVRRFARGGGDVVLCHDPEPHAFDLDAGIEP